MGNKKEIVLYDSEWIFEEEWNGLDYNWEDFVENLKCQPTFEYNCGFIAIGFANVWNGSFIGCPKNLNFADDLLTVIRKLIRDYDRIKIYFNDKGDLELALYHHDGTNYAIIRQLQDKYQRNDYYFEKIQYDLYNGNDKSAYKYTKSVKHIFKGWIF